MSEHGPTHTPLTLVERMLQFVQATTFFRDLSDGEIKLLLRKAVHHKFPMNHNVIDENDFGDSMFYILSGEVFLSRRIGEEEEFLGTLYKGDTFGENALLTGGMRTATVRTKTDCLLLEYDQEALGSLSPDLTAKLMRNIAIATNEKLGLANYLINNLYEELRSLRPKQPDWEESEEEFMKNFEDDPPV